MAAEEDGTLRCDYPGCGKPVSLQNRYVIEGSSGIYCSMLCRNKAYIQSLSQTPLRDLPPRSESGAPVGSGGASRPGNQIPRIFALADPGIGEVERCREWIADWVQKGRNAPSDDHLAAARRCLVIDTDIQWQIQAYEILRWTEARPGRPIPVESDFWSDAYPGIMLPDSDIRSEEILRIAGWLMVALLVFLLLLGVSVALTFWWAGRL
jgi:hypothetical protein